MTPEEAIKNLYAIRTVYQMDLSEPEDRALAMAIEALETVRNTDNDRVVNLNAVLRILNRKGGSIWAKIWEIKQLPSISQTGHWIIKGYNLGDDYIDECYVCSNCGEQALLYPYGRHLECLSDFCPNCGARMVGDNNGR